MTISNKRHVGPQRRACVNQPRRRWSPMWWRTEDGSLNQVKLAQEHAKEGGVESNSKNIMEPLGDG